MKKFVLMFAAMLAFVLAPLAVSAADEVVLKGEPVDITCFLSGKLGPGHATCAATCVKGGKPVGLLVKEDGKSLVYLVIPGGKEKAADILGDLMGKQVKATGKVTKKDGLAVLAITKAEAAS